MNDEQLVQRLKKHDEAALEEIMHKYNAYVSVIIYNMSRGGLSAADMEEAAADTFYSLWLNSGKVRAESLGGYIAAIAKTKTLDKLRAAGKNDAVEIDEAIMTDEYRGS